MDYSQLSDFEINKCVSVAAGLNVNMSFDVDEAYARGPVWTAPSGNCYSGIKSSKGNPFDPCNNPADAWPIIVDNLIALKPVAMHVGGHRWFATKGGGDFGAQYSDNNPLRAAMIIFLISQERANA